MFDELAETKISGDGKVTVKRHVTDEETLAEMEFAEACDEYVRAARKFEKLDRIAKAQKGIPGNLCDWFDALEGAIPSRQASVASVCRERPQRAVEHDVRRVQEGAGVGNKPPR